VNPARAVGIIGHTTALRTAPAQDTLTPSHHWRSAHYPVVSAAMLERGHGLHPISPAVRNAFNGGQLWLTGHENPPILMPEMRPLPNRKDYRPAGAR